MNASLPWWATCLNLGALLCLLGGAGNFAAFCPEGFTAGLCNNPANQAGQLETFGGPNGSVGVECTIYYSHADGSTFPSVCYDWTPIGK